MIFWSICHWISDWFWSHFWCFFDTFTIRTCNLLNHKKPFFVQWVSMILLFKKTWCLMIFLIFSVTSFSIYFFWQKNVKMDPKKDQNETTNHTKNRCLRFLAVLEDTVFSRFLETKKIGPKSRKKPARRHQSDNNSSAQRNARCQRRGKERLKTSPGSSGISQVLKF